MKTNADLMTVQEAAKAIGVSRQQIDRWIRDGVLLVADRYKVGSRVVLRFVNRSRVEELRENPPKQGPRDKEAWREKTEEEKNRVYVKTKRKTKKS